MKRARGGDVSLVKSLVPKPNSDTGPFRPESSGDPPIQIWHSRQFSKRKLQLMGALIHEVWRKDQLTVGDRMSQLAQAFQDCQQNTDRAPWAFIAMKAGGIMAQAIVIPRRINWGGHEMVIGGLARVCTHPSGRGRGLGERVVRAAMMLADSGVFPLLLFQTSFMVRPFYLKLGAEDVTNPIINSLGNDPAVCPFQDDVVMRYPACGDYPGGVIDLRGPGY